MPQQSKRKPLKFSHFTESEANVTKIREAGLEPPWRLVERPRVQETSAAAILAEKPERT
jgi:hypothetical protein